MQCRCSMAMYTTVLMQVVLNLAALHQGCIQGTKLTVPLSPTVTRSNPQCSEYVQPWVQTSWCKSQSQPHAVACWLVCCPTATRVLHQRSQSFCFPSCTPLPAQAMHRAASCFAKHVCLLGGLLLQAHRHAIQVNKHSFQCL